MRTTLLSALAALCVAGIGRAQTPLDAVDASLSSGPGGPSIQVGLPEAAQRAVPPDDDGRGTPYKVDKADNVCGLDEPRALTNPSKVDFNDLIEATPEAEAIRRRKIDRESAEGIRLLTEARARVLNACEKVRGELGYCSVWKAITRRDGKAVADITVQVKRQIESDSAAAVPAPR